MGNIPVPGRNEEYLTFTVERLVNAETNNQDSAQDECPVADYQRAPFHDPQTPVLTLSEAIADDEPDDPGAMDAACCDADSACERCFWIQALEPVEDHVNRPGGS